MVNILIHQFLPEGAVVDEAALEQFQQQWATYQKLVDADSLSHKESGSILHQTLGQRFKGGFSLLDLACGDASEMARLGPLSNIIAKLEEAREI